MKTTKTEKKTVTKSATKAELKRHTIKVSVITQVKSFEAGKPPTKPQSLQTSLTEATHKAFKGVLTPKRRETLVNTLLKCEMVVYGFKPLKTILNKRVKFITKSRAFLPAPDLLHHSLDTIVNFLSPTHSTIGLRQLEESLNFLYEFALSEGIKAVNA